MRENSFLFSVVASDENTLVLYTFPDDFFPNFSCFPSNVAISIKGNCLIEIIQAFSGGTRDDRYYNLQSLHFFAK